MMSEIFFISYRSKECGERWDPVGAGRFQVSFTGEYLQGKCLQGEYLQVVCRGQVDSKSRQTGRQAGRTSDK